MKIEDVGIDISEMEKYLYFSKQEKRRKNKHPRYKINGKVYNYKEKCESCGKPFLCVNPNSRKCSIHCGFSGKGNPFYGRHHTEEAKKKMGEYKKEWMKNNEHPTSDKEVRKKISNSKKGSNHYCYGKKGKNSPNWKGGVKEKKIPLYDTYASQIDWAEEVRRNSDDINILEVRCTYCGRWFIPKITSVYNRIQYLKGNDKYTENRFYCSNSCKHECPIYHKAPEVLMKEDAIRAGRLNWIELNREVQPELRQLVFERDNYNCQKCGNTEHLHCHHIFPASIEPIESADIDNCITYCNNCHKEVHNQDGCKYGQLRNCIE